MCKMFRIKYLLCLAIKTIFFLSFFLSHINSQMKQQLIESTPGKYLFGEDLADRIRTAQNIHRSGNVLQPTQNRPSVSRNANNNNHLNLKTPYRRAAAAAAAGRQRSGSPARPSRPFRPRPLPPSRRRV